MKFGGLLMAALVVVGTIYAVNYFAIGGGVSKLGVKS